MLADLMRTGTYKRAISMNACDFNNQIVLDVGCGSGILSIFAAQAGAKRVYAVEAAADMAEMARLLVRSNGLEHKITVITGKVEEITLPEQVDLIVSEPIGFLLVHERMLESYIVARERFLKPTSQGKKQMFPSRAAIRTVPFTDNALYSELLGKAQFWGNHTDFFGVNLQALQTAALQQSFAQPVIGYVDPQTLISRDVSSFDIDFETARVKQDLAEITIPLRFEVSKTSMMHGLACWFDADFLGSSNQVKLDTSPTSPGTHWYQVRLLLAMPIAVNATQTVTGQLKMRVNNKFSYDIELCMQLEGTREEIKQINYIALHDTNFTYSYVPTVTFDGDVSGHYTEQDFVKA